MTRWPARRNKRRAETGRHAAAWSSLSTPRATIFKASSGKGRSPESSAAAATILLDLLRHLLADAKPCGLSQTLDQILAKLSHASTPPSGDLQCRRLLIFSPSSRSDWRKSYRFCRLSHRSGPFPQSFPSHNAMPGVTGCFPSAHRKASDTIRRVASRSPPSTCRTNAK